MLASSMPVKFPVPFANGAGPDFVRTIPVASQIGINQGWASLTDGFPPLNFTPIAAGGVPPFGQDMNGILRQVTQWLQWEQLGGQVYYDADFAAATGGYPLFATLPSSVVPGNVWMTIVDGNTTDPDSTAAANWVPAPGTFGTGRMFFHPAPESIFGSVLANAMTIGNASSGATSLASAMTWPLFKWIWTWFSNTRCPIFTSTGVPSTRGANAAADFAANKAIATLDMRGAGMMGMDTMGAGPTSYFSGVPTIAGSGNAAGSLLGENLHTLTPAEIAAHIHTFGANTNTESNFHTHDGSGTTGVNNIDHSHPYTASNGSNILSDGANRATNSGTFQANTGGSSNSHQHAFSFTSATNSTTHTHTVFGSTDSAGGGGSHNNVERIMVGYIYLKL
jgi:hypothetical protein